MKRTIFIVSLIFMSSLGYYAQEQNEEILLTIDDQEVTKNEFERIYNDGRIFQ